MFVGEEEELSRTVRLTVQQALAGTGNQFDRCDPAFSFAESFVLILFVATLLIQEDTAKGDRKSVDRPIETEDAGWQNSRQSEAISSHLKNRFPPSGPTKTKPHLRKYFSLP
ncbi:hypothetical protein B0H14DRAFT_3529772 [Mycena olivaceomarginata]|nr:hypothetical protein B0H14DRAFT_3529772 [Mycena olivaceomarginata]